MHQPDIAPLAKRLAEENNVDWRRLRGSGDGGRVVERDVLEYLARVMAGDEALDPTPEPVPEGMTAWPEVDVRAAHDDDDDLLEGTSTVEDDIFLFDDEAADAGPASVGAVPVDLDAPVPADDDAIVDVDTDADTDADLDTDLDGFGTDLAVDHAAGHADAADHSGAVTVRDVDDIDEEDLLVSGDTEPEPTAAPQADPMPAASPDAAPEFHQPDGIPDLFAAHDAVESGPAEPDDPSPALFADEEPDDASAAPFAAGEHEAAVPRWDDGPLLEDDLAPPDASPERAPGPDLDEAPEAAAPVAAPPLALGSEQADASGPSVAPPVAEPAGAAGAVAAALPLWSHGHVWRRHIDLSALVAAQVDVAGELGRDAPVPLAAFLVRAAHKALGGQGAVALAVVDAAGARTVPVPAAADFAQALAACEQALNGAPAAASEGASHDLASHDLASDAVGHGGAFEDEEREPDLIVADLSDLGIDDAVLRLGAPVLTLGRVLIDTQSGARRAVLALAGDGVEGPGAARRLARVADLLEAPVRVVL